MSNQEPENKDKLLDHNYDGIQEYDNDLPRWWLNIFWVTTIFAVLYVGYVHFGFSKTDDEKLAAQLAEVEAKRSAAKQSDSGSSQDINEEYLLAVTKDNSALKLGHEVYVGKCAVCHGQKAEGLIGPNMTDDYWIHGGSLMDLRAITLKGVLEKGMLAWQGVLSDQEVNAVVAYIRTLRGSNPDNAKQAEGELYVP